MDTADIRRRFIEHFEKAGHTAVVQTTVACAASPINAEAPRIFASAVATRVPSMP